MILTKKRAETRKSQLADKCLHHLQDNPLPPISLGISAIFVFWFSLSQGQPCLKPSEESTISFVSHQNLK